MDNNDNINAVAELKHDCCELVYNTQRKKMNLPEYGRSIQKMVDYLKSIEDREKRNQQAQAIIKVMEILNPAVHLQEDYLHKLWDHLYIIADFDLDVDSPYPCPDRNEFSAPPAQLPAYNKKPLKASHYGRNIENILNMIADHEDGEMKDAMIRAIAVYMRQQYLIWNKDTVSDETIFNDIEKLSDYRIKIPEGLQLSQIQKDQTFSRPGQNRKKNNRGSNQRQKNRK